MSEPRKTIDCSICGKPFTWKNDVTAGETVDTLAAFGAVLCPKGLAHLECAELAHGRDWLKQWQIDVALGLVPSPIFSLPIAGTTIKTAKMEWIKL